MGEKRPVGDLDSAPAAGFANPPVGLAEAEDVLQKAPSALVGVGLLRRQGLLEALLDALARGAHVGLHLLRALLGHDARRSTLRQRPCRASNIPLSRCSLFARCTLDSHGRRSISQRGRAINCPRTAHRVDLGFDPLKPLVRVLAHGGDAGADALAHANVEAPLHRGQAGPELT